jgi:hypothetical protein
LEADWKVIGWPGIITFFKGGGLLQEKTIRAAGRNLKGDPSSLTLCTSDLKVVSWEDEGWIVSDRCVIIGSLSRSTGHS